MKDTIISYKVKSLSHIQLFATPCTVARQAPPSMKFSRQEYWSGLPFPSPGDLLNPGTEPRSPALQADALQSELPGKLLNLSANAGDTKDVGLIPGSGGSPEVGNGNPLQYSCLENFMDGGAWWATVHGVSKSWTRLSNFTFTF